MPYLGVDYYPEHWPESQIEEDLQGIKDLGANIVRIGEFAWHLMEPEEGHFDFSYFDRVIKKIKDHGFSIMFGTPTATFPAWLYKKDPSIVSKDETGQPRVFGGRRQYCFNSDVYHEHASRITQKLVEHYRDEEAIIAWQVDNEFGHEGSDICFCEQCHSRFQSYLHTKYETIDALNEEWGTIFWGQTYNEFSEVPMPTSTITTHNPSLKLEWARFRSDSLNRFANDMTEIVKQHKGENQTVTTNTTGDFFNKYFDHEENVKAMDFVSYDNYPVWGGLEKPVSPDTIAMMHDFNRGLLGKNYWIVEELMGAQGHDVIGYLPRPDQAKMWSYQAFAHGCSHLLYFRWRGMTRGAEQFCYGVIDQDNRYGRKYREVQSLFEDVKDRDDLLEAPIHSDIAVVYDYDNIWSWRAQKQSKDFDFKEELLRLYRPFFDWNVSMDVIPSSRDFSSYKVILVPVMQVMDPEFAERLKDFAQNGGTVVFSFRTGVKGKDNNLRFGEPLPGLVSDLTGVYVEESESLTKEHALPLQGQGKYAEQSASATIWRDLLVPETADVLYKYNDPFYDSYAAVTKNTFGEGTAYYIGGGLDSNSLDKISEEILEEQGIEYMETEKGVEIHDRRVGEESYRFVINHNEETSHFQGEPLQPFESKIIKL
ncbi:beta-galactosidase [Halobacillus yeomjeoni]|uniref:Beta-galactosidase n=1 Tax=Halobacillus yeomjeoni TaxID=311194 RepID=A0A931MVQ2_9BACI|nr:beta-galactosidase [Halobacillus yeomjeoni]MBH0230656.1 beta-galactosidase [Halobacillus yeomjeoni]